MAESGGDKKHEATPYRRQKAREEGQIAKSQDLASAVLLLAGVLTLESFGGHLMEVLSNILVDQLTSTDYHFSDSRLHLGAFVRTVIEQLLH